MSGTVGTVYGVLHKVLYEGALEILYAKWPQPSQPSPLARCRETGDDVRTRMGLTPCVERVYGMTPENTGFGEGIERQRTGPPLGLVDAEHSGGGHPAGTSGKYDTRVVFDPPGLADGGSSPGGRPGERPGGPCGPRGALVLAAVEGYLKDRKSSMGQARRRKRPGAGRKGDSAQTSSLLAEETDAPDAGRTGAVAVGVAVAGAAGRVFLADTKNPLWGRTLNRIRPPGAAARIQVRNMLEHFQA